MILPICWSIDWQKMQEGKRTGKSEDTRHREDVERAAICAFSPLYCAFMIMCLLKFIYRLVVKANQPQSSLQKGNSNVLILFTLEVVLGRLYAILLLILFAPAKYLSGGLPALSPAGTSPIMS